MVRRYQCETHADVSPDARRDPRPRRVRPARPHHKLTDDGRRMREVLTYSRRGSRFTPRQQAGVGRVRRALVDPRRGGRRAGLLAGRLVRPRGAADRRDRLGHRRGDRRARGGPARPRRPGLRGLAPGRRRHPRPGRRGRPDQRAAAQRRRGLVDGAPRRRRAAWPSSGRSSPTPGTRSGTTSAGWSTPEFAAPRREPAGARRRSGGWPPTGPTTPSRWSRCSTPSRCSTGGVVERWAERPVTKFERKGVAAGRADHRPGLPRSGLGRVGVRRQPGPVQEELQPQPLGVPLGPARAARSACPAGPPPGTPRAARRRTPPGCRSVAPSTCRAGRRGRRGAAAAGRGRSGPAAGSAAPRARAGSGAAGGRAGPRTRSPAPWRKQKLYERGRRARPSVKVTRRRASPTAIIAPRYVRRRGSDQRIDAPRTGQSGTNGQPSCEDTMTAPEQFVTDGGLETDLIFHHGIDLPDFAAFPLLDDERGRDAADELLRRSTPPSPRAAGAGLLLETPTWRANPDWGARARVRRRRAWTASTATRSSSSASSASAGPTGCRARGSAARSGRAATATGRAPRVDPDEAADYHRPQLAAFAEAGADLATALTLTDVGEALGVVARGRRRRAAGRDLVHRRDRRPAARRHDPRRGDRDGRRRTAGRRTSWSTARTRPRRARAGRRRVLARAGPRAPGERLDDEPRGARRGRRARRRRPGRSWPPPPTGCERSLPAVRIVGGCCGTDARHVAASGETGPDRQIAPSVPVTATVERPRTPRRIHRAWWVAAVTMGALVAAAGFRSSTGALLEPLENEFGWSRATTSGAVSLNLVIYGLTAPFAAALMERFGVRRVVGGVAGAGRRSAPGLTLVMTAAWQLWLLWGVAVGVGTGSLALVFGAIVANRWFVRHRGLVIGVFSAASSTGQLIFLPAIAHLADGPGWRWAAGLVAVFALAAGARWCCWSCATSPPTSAPRRTARPTTGRRRRRSPIRRGAARVAIDDPARGSARSRTFWILFVTLLDLRLVDQRPDRHPLHPRRPRPRHAGDHQRRPARPDRDLRHRRHRRAAAGSPTGSTRATCCSATTSSAGCRCWSCRACSGRTSHAEPVPVHRVLRPRLGGHRAADGRAVPPALRAREVRRGLRLGVRRAHGRRRRRGQLRRLDPAAAAATTSSPG